MKNVSGAAYAASKYNEYTVREETTLLEFIIKMTSVSRNRAKDILSGHGITVDRRNTTRYDEPLRPGQIVRISKHKRSNQLLNRYVKIVYEDKDLVVIEKSEGILSMPATAKQYSAKQVLDEYFAKRHFKCTAHTVHRLDRETSGLMMYAKNREIAQILEDNWHDIVFDRRYVAVVSGKLEKEGGTIESWLKDNKAYITYSSPEDPGGGKFAITHYHTLKTTDRFSLVELKLETGRKNQIRVHMQDIGHPVLGDQKYGNGFDPIGRLCLHAYRLNFYHPRTGEVMDFETPFPKEFMKLFANTPKPATEETSPDETSEAE
ncbi:MAG: RluA family pseudouridine synthase [Bacteroidaceae bacterium]|nr:RluA family pseudouridine synthase [Bacteroidaceae bacterium]